MDWQRTIILRPQADNWDGPHFRLYQCGIDYIETQLPPHRLFLQAIDPEGSWIYVLSGSLYYVKGENRHLVEAGQALITRRPEPGSILRSGKNTPLNYIWLHVTGEFALRTFDYLHLNYGQIQNLPFNSHAVRRAKRIIHRVETNPNRPASYWSAQTFHWLNAWWQSAEAANSAVSPLTLGAVNPSRLVGYAPRTIKNFAAEMGYSRSHLSRKLAAEWASPPGRTLRKVRLEEAARLLRTTRMNVWEIAGKVGYSTSAAFSRAFARQFQRSPVEYRRMH